MWKWFLAYFRLSQKAVCDMSIPGDDYHDYPDAKDFSSEEKGVYYPMHGYVFTCRHCNKEFTI